MQRSIPKWLLRVKSDDQAEDKSDSKPDLQSDDKSDFKPDDGLDNISDHKSDSMSDSRPESRPDSKPDSKPNLGQESRQDSEPGSKPHSKPGLIQTTLISSFSKAVPLQGKEVSHSLKKPKEDDEEVPLQLPAEDEKEGTSPNSPRKSTRLASGEEGSSSGTTSTDGPKQSTALASIAQETKALLPDLLKRRPDAPPTGILYTDIGPLDQRFNPRFRTEDGSQAGTAISVVNSDTLDVAIALQAERSSDLNPTDRRVLVLSMANAQHGGGGWLKGALAQEEALCYRSSLSFTLKRRFYPFAERSAIYSPTVVVFRSSLAEGHAILPDTHDHPAALPVIGVVSVAAIRNPLVTTAEHPARYRRVQDRELMKHKMRVVLRVAARKRHRRLVLAALGCGAFHNPPEEVVACWKEVFAEHEFRGGWWERVVFAVLSSEREMRGGERRSNFEIFQDGLEGCVV